MADNVQWIKLKVGMFDGNSFKKIKRAKIGGVSYRDKLTAVWFELLDLAGKCNANGYLIDNNEIPYHSFDDIATMLDREEKEIELCMQFFINEHMVEIIDDVYCLSNFIKYQNQEGLEKIREQKRLAQAKWRERKKLGLVGIVDETQSTVDSTQLLPSFSTSNSTSNADSSSKSKKEQTIDDIIKEVEHDCLQMEIKEFVKMRKAIKKPLTPHALELALKELNKLSVNIDEQVLIVRQSIQHCWQSFYALKTDTKDTKQSQKDKSFQAGMTILNEMLNGGR